MTTPTLADRFEALYFANAPLMKPRPAHLDLVMAFFAGAAELVPMLSGLRELETDQLRVIEQDRWLDEIFDFAERMANRESLNDASNGEVHVQSE